MEWWDDLWLNEGFATWMETGITDRLHPDWKMWEQFITDMQGHALDLDALRSSHPIQVRPLPPARPANTSTAPLVMAPFGLYPLVMAPLVASRASQVPIGRAEEVEQVFDAISYCKGGSVI